MTLWERYHVAHSVAEALSILATHPGKARAIAGGTDLLIDLQQSKHPPVPMLVDITRIEELKTIAVQGDSVALGAGVTHNAIVAHPVLRARATCLVESCGVIGGPQVRNVATLGGNVAHALPAADGTLSLVALDAEAEVASMAGRTWHPIGALFLAPGQSRVDPGRELITHFRFKLCGPGEGSAFKRVMRPQGVALPILGCAVRVRLGGGQFAAAHIAIGPVGPTPTRATGIEAMLTGQPADAATIVRAAKTAREQLHPRTSKYRATAAYRSEMIELLIREALTLAVERAKSGEAVPQGVG